ncbi:hypothetical protein [Streptomyces globisporus]
MEQHATPICSPPQIEIRPEIHIPAPAPAPDDTPDNVHQFQR